MITMELIDERWCPVLRCDACLERITDPEMAGVVWGQDHYQATSPAPLLMLCKTNGCLGQGPGRHRLWEALDVFFVHLTGNAGMSRRWGRARARARCRL